MTKDQDLDPKNAAAEAPTPPPKLVAPKAKLPKGTTTRRVVTEEVNHAFSASDLEKGRATLEALNAGPQFAIYVPPKKKGSKDSDWVKLASINGVAFWGRRGETKTVPLEVARIAWDAGVIQGPPPPGANIPLDPMGEVPPALTEEGRARLEKMNG